MEEQQFVLRWHNHETTVLKNLPQLFELGILTDITLSAGNQIIKAHRLILATCSSYFLQLFQNMNSLQHPIIVLHNANFEDLKSLISFMYKGQCLIIKSQLPSLLSLARLLQIQGLCDMKISEDLFNCNNNVQEEILTNAKIDIMTEEFVETPSDFKLNGSNEINLYDKLSSNNESTSSKRLNNYEHEIPTLLKKSAKDLLYKCFVCGKYLSNQYNLRVHMETHEEGCYMCHSCSHVSRSRDALRKHVSYRHQEQYNSKKRKKIDTATNQ